MSENHPQKPALLRVESLTYKNHDKTILSEINFEVEAGERIAVFGPSGAGKSSLVRLMNRLDEPTSGTVFIDGEDYRQLSPREVRKRLGLVMQQPNLFPGTVADNLRFGPAAHGKTLADSSVEELLNSVDLAGFAERDVSTLSGGEAQRVNLARTLANEPEVLLLDEPTSSLDQSARSEVEETILSVLQSRDVTCVLVTHDQDQVKRLADRVLLLRKGKLVADGPAEEVFNAQSMD